MKKLFICLGIILGIGVLCFGIGAIAYANDSSLFKIEYEMKSVEDTANFSNLSIDCTSGAFELYESSDDKYHFEYPESKYSTYSCLMADDLLSIKETNKNWFDFSIGKKPTVKLYIPASLSGKLTIKQTSGSFTSYISTLSVNSFEFTSSSGLLTMNNLVSNSTIYGKMSSGKIAFDKVSATTSITLKNTSGSISCLNTTTSNMNITMSSGLITLEKIKTEKLEVTITSGTVKAKEITCNQLFHTGSTGSGEYTCKGTQEDYSYDLHVTTGSINVGTTSCSSDLKIGTSEKKIYAHVSTGSVKISFID